ncbi:MAG TPA: hypothetical protein VNC50_05110, partial [Planctomycetia bacterium]|nr:hypothetical protein [Planctomycetia bacterium]
RRAMQTTIRDPPSARLALVDGKQTVRIYDVPFRPAWWMRAAVGLAALGLAELLVRIILSTARTFGVRHSPPSPPGGRSAVRE